MDNKEEFNGKVLILLSVYMSLAYIYLNLKMSRISYKR